MYLHMKMVRIGKNAAGPSIESIMRVLQNSGALSAVWT